MMILHDTIAKYYYLADCGDTKREQALLAYSAPLELDSG